MISSIPCGFQDLNINHPNGMQPWCHRGPGEQAGLAAEYTTRSRHKGPSSPFRCTCPSSRHHIEPNNRSPSQIQAATRELNVEVAHAQTPTKLRRTTASSSSLRGAISYSSSIDIGHDRLVALQLAVIGITKKQELKHGDHAY
ncbi:hypothetical protein [Prochlorococcus sp. MIT 1201]|uniref:hypothetical protein n=1 Tax=Prochlorococcus sp. MIT 1201 TaxID=3082535 RepID=UPI0039A5256B